jgi:hypothetical protein
MALFSMNYGLCCSGPWCEQEDKIVHILSICASFGHPMHSSSWITDGNDIVKCFPCYDGDDPVAAHGSGVAVPVSYSGSGDSFHDAIKE